MQNSFRWYGPNDPVKLTDIRQSNAEYIVTSLHQIPYGEKWNKNDIKKRINYINKYNDSYKINLKWNVVESIPVHNNIKLRDKNFKKLINNYKDTIANIASNKIYTICYNFMPIVDWTRTQLDFKLPTDGLALRFNYLQIIIFEMYILKLKDLEKRYTKKQIQNAEKIFRSMNSNDIKNLKIAVMGGLPASETKYSVNGFKKMLKSYKSMKTDNIESLISKTIYKASLYLDEFRWDEWLELCDEDFYYSIQAFSPEIDKNMIYLDGTFDQMKSITEMLPKHNTDRSPLSR